MSSRRRFVALVSAVVLVATGCSGGGDDSATTTAGSSANGIPALTYEIVSRSPHDTAAFTEGFTFGDGGRLFESLGLEGNSSVREVDWLSGACLMLRREALDQVGVFDARYFMYLEDTDLCLRMHRSGWGVYYVPSAGFVHTIGRSSDQAQPRMILAHHRSMCQYYCKHMARGLGLLLVPLALAAIGARCLLVLAKNRMLWWRTTRIAGTNKT